MTTRASIRCAGGSLVLPARSPYELELLFEHAARAARTSGAARLRLGAAVCVVEQRDATAWAPCAGCHRGLGGLAYRLACRTYCAGCARALLPGDDQPRTPASARRAS